MMARSRLTQIFVLAAPMAMLLLAGCSRERLAAGKECRQFKKCDEEAFFEAYDSMGKCKKLETLRNKVARTEAENEYGSLCAKTVSKRNRCFSKQIDCDYFDDREAWEANAAEECEKEIEEVEAECVDNDD